MAPAPLRLQRHVLADGHLVVPNDGALFGVGREPHEIGEVLASAGLLPDELRLDIQCLLVTFGDRVILFDAGAGELIPTAGRLRDSLVRAGFTARAVTDVLITHAHADHVGGLVANGALAFPSATIRMSAPEWAAMQASRDEGDRAFVAVVAPRVTTFAPGAEVLPGVTALATPGHTLGHSSYAVGHGAERTIVLGDIVHHHVISLQRPAWRVAIDANPTAAEALRRTWIPQLARDHARVFVGHFPYPGLGTIREDATFVSDER